MSKIRAQGADVAMSAAFETTYGVAPEDGWRTLMLSSFESGYKKPLGYEAEVGAGSESQDPYYDPVAVEPSLEVHARTDSIGFFLKAMFGAPVTTGNGPYTHVFTSGKDLPSLSIEEGHAQLSPALYRLVTGLKLGSMEMDIGRSGPMKFSFSGIGQNHVLSSASAADEPVAFTGAKFVKSNCVIKLDGTVVGQVTGGKITMSNGLEAVETVRGDGLIEGADEGERSAEGELTVRMIANTETIFDTSSAPKALSIEFSLGSVTLKIELGRVFFEGSSPGISGPGGLSVSRNFRAAKPSANALTKITLVNATASY